MDRHAPRRKECSSNSPKENVHRTETINRENLPRVLGRHNNMVTIGRGTRTKRKTGSRCATGRLLVLLPQEDVSFLHRGGFPRTPHLRGGNRSGCFKSPTNPRLANAEITNRSPLLSRSGEISGAISAASSRTHPDTNTTNNEIGRIRMAKMDEGAPERV